MGALQPFKPPSHPPISFLNARMTVTNRKTPFLTCKLQFCPLFVRHRKARQTAERAELLHPGIPYEDRG
jgi:hypothetical protein